jgi:uncharacterized protein
MKKLDLTTAVLLIVGGLNWGVVGVTGSDLVGALFGDLSPVSRAVYALVGLSALYQALRWKATQHRWAPATAR